MLLIYMFFIACLGEQCQLTGETFTAHHRKGHSNDAHFHAQHDVATTNKKDSDTHDNLADLYPECMMIIYIFIYIGDKIEKNLQTLTFMVCRGEQLCGISFCTS